MRYGIDLGTTFSSIARYDSNRRIVEIAQLNTMDGGLIIPSVVYYPENQNPIVGAAAMNAYRRYPKRVIIGVKRGMGENWKTEPIDGKRHTPAEISSEILKVLKKDGESFFGEEIKDVIITVPAYFGPDQRRDTEEAGRLAGLNVLRTLEEPSAAALAYSIEKIDDIAGRNILVYDLGGGTFDVTLIHCEREEHGPGAIGLKIRTICKEGDRHLGGLNWDQVLENLAADKCLKQFNYDPRLDAADNATLVEQCERNKRHLNQLDTVTIPCDMRGHTVEVTRSEFEEVTAFRLEQTRLMLETVLATVENPSDALLKQFSDILPLRRNQIDVLLCGGATKMLAVPELVQKVMGKEPLRHGNPELHVVMGAAFSSYLSPHLPDPGEDVKEAGDPHVTVFDGDGKETKIFVPPENIEIVVRPLGIEVVKDADHPGLGTRIDVIIPGGASVGDIHTGHYAAAYDGALAVELVLYEGDDPDPAKCTRLKSFMLNQGEPGRPKGWGVTVELKYDDSGKIIGKAIDDKTGNEMEISYAWR
jgi:molecular chaperone DnaK